MLRFNTSKTTIQTVSRGFQATEQLSPRAGPIQFVRGKRTKKVKEVSPATQRIITQLSVISARKKLPKVIKLSNEDLIRHDTVTRAWGLYQKDKRQRQNELLNKQYEAMQEAMTDLKKVNRTLYELANEKEVGKRFPLEARIPVDYPPNKIWYYEYTPKEQNVEEKK